LSSFDTRLFLDVNRFANRTAWAHGFMRDYAEYAGIALLVALVALALWQARGGIYGGGSLPAVADALWVGLAAFVAWCAAQPLTHIVGRIQPYAAIHRPVLLLVPRSHAFSFPSGYSVIAGAIVIGLWLCRSRLVAVAATAVGLLLAFAEVYVGAEYPVDAIGGLLLGALVVAALRPLAVPALSRGLERLATVNVFRALLGVPRPGRRVSPGPAARPVGVIGSGAVRIIEPDAKLVPHAGDRSAAPTVPRSATPAKAHVYTKSPLERSPEQPGHEPAEGSGARSSPTQG
jgi:membrane-associated phospholipid phosphatase